MTDVAGFDLYCKKNGIMPGEEPAAFAAYLHETFGWDGTMVAVAPPEVLCNSYGCVYLKNHAGKHTWEGNNSARLRHRPVG
jgi:hypothetical protein